MSETHNTVTNKVRPGLPIPPERIKWTIKPPLCSLKDGKFADCIYIDVEGKEVQYCGAHYASVLAIEAARAFQKKKFQSD